MPCGTIRIYVKQELFLLEGVREEAPSDSTTFWVFFLLLLYLICKLFI